MNGIFQKAAEDEIANFKLKCVMMMIWWSWEEMRCSKEKRYFHFSWMEHNNHNDDNEFEVLCVLEKEKVIMSRKVMRCSLEKSSFVNASDELVKIALNT